MADHGRRARAEFLAARRQQPGDDWDGLVAEIIAELEADPDDAVFDKIVAAAPPPEDWDPERARMIRRALREANRPDRP